LYLTHESYFALAARNSIKTNQQLLLDFEDVFTAFDDWKPQNEIEKEDMITVCASYVNEVRVRIWDSPNFQNVVELADLLKKKLKTVQAMYAVTSLLRLFVIALKEIEKRGATRKWLKHYL